MTYINLTGHEVHELDSNIRIEPSDTVIRAQCRTTKYVNEDGITCHKSHVTRLSAQLPEPQDGVIYIVSALALNGIPDERIDVVAPKQVERFANGKIRGCRGFRHK